MADELDAGLETGLETGEETKEAPKRVTLKVYGNEEEVSLEEAIADAQKYRAGTQKFQEAEQKLKEAQELEVQHKHAIQTYEDLKKMQTGDLDAARRVLVGQGHSEEDVDAYLAQQAGAASVTPSNGKGTTGLSKDDLIAVLKEAGVDLEAVKDLQGFREGLARGNIRIGDVASQIVNATADNKEAAVRNAIKGELALVPHLKRMLSQGADPEALADIAEGILAKRFQGRPLDQSVIRAAVTESAKRLQAVTPARASGTLSVDGGLSDDAYFDDTPLKVPPITSPEHEEFTAKRLLQIDRELRAQGK